jgi:LPXTG-site transpeptidase (sortase) family protein
MSKQYKLIFAIRFTGYFLFFSGILAIVFLLGPLVQAEVKYRTDRITGVKRTVASINPSPSPQADGQKPTESFANIKANENEIVPVSTDFGIVIEKIDANAKIIANVNPASEREYTTALGQGVAQALGSTPPGEKGNLYLFSHSTDAPWNIIRFNAIFYLLRELAVGDRVVIFYQNKRYDYIVFDKVVASPTDVSYLTNRYDAPVLTMQTCDPPGTLINRLIVRAKLVNS